MTPDPLQVARDEGRVQAPSRTAPRLTLVLVLGCALIGALMESTDPARRVVAWWVRPMLATGVLGGFTTFSAYALDVDRMLASGRAGAAIGYLVTTPVLALLGVVAGSALVRRLDAGGGHGAGAPR